MASNNSKEIEAAVAAYNCDFNEFFIKCEWGFTRKRLVQACICRGCSFSYQFAQDILSNKIQLSSVYYDNTNIRKAVCASFIMNNHIDIELINETKPFCIWYPKVPTLETCERIKKETNEIDYPLTILCILMNWFDLFKTLDIEAESTLLTLCQFTKRTKFYDFLISRVQEDKIYNFIDFENEIVTLDESNFETEFKPKEVILFNYPQGYPRGGVTKRSFCRSIPAFLKTIKNPETGKDELEESFSLEFKYPGGYGALSGITFEYFMLTKDMPMYYMDYESANLIKEDEVEPLDIENHDPDSDFDSDFDSEFERRLSSL